MAALPRGARFEALTVAADAPVAQCRRWQTDCADYSLSVSGSSAALHASIRTLNFCRFIFSRHGLTHVCPQALQILLPLSERGAKWLTHCRRNESVRHGAGSLRIPASVGCTAHRRRYYIWTVRFHYCTRFPRSNATHSGHWGVGIASDVALLPAEAPGDCCAV